MSKSLKIIGLGLLVVIAVAATVAGSIYLANRATHKNAEQASCPSGRQTVHRVVIKNGTVAPQHTVAKRCDNLKITNLDNTNRLMAFGRHSDHTPYDGIEERLLSDGQSLQVQLIDTGNFRFHDHLHDEVQGTFTVQ